MNYKEKLFHLVDEMKDYTVDIRRRIHQNPELSFHEFETSALIEQELTKAGIPYEKSPAAPGLIATIDSWKPGKLLMLRADMDALPIDEETDLPFKSRNNGVMHACGHDVHTANLLTVGIILNQMKEFWCGRIKLVFQPAEEHNGGGREMIKNGLMDDLPDACLAIHVGSKPKGLIELGSGYRTAYSDRCTAKIHGRAAHSSTPQDGVDAILIAANIVQALNTITSRSLDPKDGATCNVGVIKGGRAGNIVADEAEIVCMLRNTNPVSRRIVFQRCRDICEHISAAMGGSCDTEILEGYPAVYNDPQLTQFVEHLIRDNTESLYAGIEAGIPADYVDTNPGQSLGAEDFGFYAQKAPSCFIFIGTGEYAPAHSQKFQVDENYIQLCTRLMSLFALEFMNQAQ